MTTARLDPFATAPKAMRLMGTFEQGVRELGLDPRLLHLIRLRASQLNGCAYCIDMHCREAREDGEAQRRLDLLQAWREVDLYDDRERAALAWTEALTLVADTGASDQAYASLAAVFTEAERVAVTLAIVTINGWNRIAIGFRSAPGLA